MIAKSVLFVFVVSIVASADLFASTSDREDFHLQACKSQLGLEKLSAEIIDLNSLKNSLPRERVKVRAQQFQTELSDFAKRYTNQIHQNFCTMYLNIKDSSIYKNFKDYDNKKSVFENDKCSSERVREMSYYYTAGMTDFTNPAIRNSEILKSIGNVISCEKVLIKYFGLEPKIINKNRIKIKENLDGSVRITIDNSYPDIKCSNPFDIPKPIVCLARGIDLIRKVKSNLVLGAPDFILPDPVADEPSNKIEP